MPPRKKLMDYMDESNGAIGGADDSVAALPEAVQPKAPVINEAPGELVTAETVRAAALSQMPNGSSEMFEILPRLGIEIPQPVVCEGSTLEEAIAADLILLNILLAKVVGNLQFQSTLTQALAKVDEVMGDRLNAALYQQGQNAQANRFHGVLAALKGGDAKGGFRFSTPSSYAVPQGWEVFADVEPEKAALPEGEI